MHNALNWMKRFTECEKIPASCSPCYLVNPVQGCKIGIRIANLSYLAQRRIDRGKHNVTRVMGSETNMESKQVGAGGTPGGIGIFLVGFVMACAGGWLLTNQVTVSGNGLGSSFVVPVIGFRMHSFGLSLIPFIAGVGFLFFNGKSIVGWLLTIAGLTIILVGILMSLHIYFQPTSLFNTLIMLVLLFGGLGLIARSLKAIPASQGKTGTEAE